MNVSAPAPYTASYRNPPGSARDPVRRMPYNLTMSFLGWSYDIAREQTPRPDVVAEMLNQSKAAGFNAVGLYLEHRFAYPSAPWAAGPGALHPDNARRLIDHAKELQLRLLPLLNTLGHMEGFIRAEGGQWLAEGPCNRQSLQICPSRADCIKFAKGLIADAADVFDDEWLHIGGDETWQLGQCSACTERAELIGTGGLYAEFYSPLCRFVLERGRRPCMWGDMLLQHPEALDTLPRETIIFDWQYESSPLHSTQMFREHGFDVVCCPSLQTYNAPWCFLPQSRENVDAHLAAAKETDALGMLLTTWEFSGFTTYLSVLPLIYSIGRHAAFAEDWDAALAASADEAYVATARLLGDEIPQQSALLAPGTWRLLREHFVLRQNPFSLWQVWRDEANSTIGERIAEACDHAAETLPANHVLRLAVDMHRMAVRWVRQAEEAHGLYVEGDLPAAAKRLEQSSELLRSLRPGLEQAAIAGGSSSDLYRLDRIVERVMQAAERIRNLSPASQYRPAFGTLVHAAYLPHDQAAWATHG